VENSDNRLTIIRAEQALEAQSQVTQHVSSTAAWAWAQTGASRRRNGRFIVENRRRLHRRPAGWAASYQLVGEQTSGWQDCRVVDISVLGLGISFDHPNSAELVGRLVSVNLPGDGSCVKVRLEGQIRNASATMSRDIRVGIEFVRLSETEQAITAVLSVMSDVLVNT
jgi:hypothetical protein